MTYKVLIEPEAFEEIDLAFKYYKQLDNDDKIRTKLYNEIRDAFTALERNPFYQLRSKHFRAIPLKNFPYLIFFEIIENQGIVKVLSFFNTYQNPDKYP